MQECVTPEAAQAALGATVDFDAAPLLEHVKSPTLVMHRRQYPLMDVEVARRLASHIPNARLALLEGTSLAPFLGDTEAVLAAINEFLGEGEQAVAASALPEPSAFRTVLFTDVEGSTALTQRLGDARARELLREHERIVREALAAHGGSEVKTMGDGFMASFGSATRALECAIAMRRAFEERNRDVGAALAPSPGAASSAPTEPLHIRIGLNAGEPIAEEDADGRGDLFGTAVIAAARIAAQAEGGEILASDVVRQLVAGKGFLFADRGDAVLRGFDDPVRLYEVRWREAA
ncbi:MAG TPA: adenylate/guanylate cyclase domain-containing protein [Dehalococcoidia bacterium]|nr:adenylate/guanylate cyclase domain-containing protein [Dehalococcoidia bacterium]